MRLRSRISRPRITPSLAVSIAALLVASGGGAYALTQDRPTAKIVSVCVRHHGGAIYQAHTCAKHDTRITWNKKGRRGRAGASGQPGQPGSQGPQGPQGPVGPATGPAGGALTGSFPNPRLATGAVSPDNLANGGIGLAKLATWHAGSGNIGGITVTQGTCGMYNFGTAPASALASDTVLAKIVPTSGVQLPGNASWVLGKLSVSGSSMSMIGGVCTLGGAITLPNPFELEFYGFR